MTLRATLKDVLLWEAENDVVVRLENNVGIRKEHLIYGISDFSTGYQALLGQVKEVNLYVDVVALNYEKIETFL